jgi:hypothetical protein
VLITGTDGTGTDVTGTDSTGTDGTVTDSTGTDCQQTGENRKMIIFMIFIAKQLTGEGREGGRGTCVGK